jgi:hypothetical protein
LTVVWGGPDGNPRNTATSLVVSFVGTMLSNQLFTLVNCPPPRRPPLQIRSVAAAVAGAIASNENQIRARRGNDNMSGP